MKISLRYFLPLLAVTCGFDPIHSQNLNLIMNPGFEQYDSVKTVSANPQNFDYGRSSFDHVKGWYNPTLSSPDFYCTKSGYYNDQIKRYMMTTGSAWGNCCAGASCLLSIPEREYLGGQLMRPLEAGKIYRFSILMILNGISNYMCDTLGVFFSTAVQPKEATVGQIKNYVPQLLLNTRLQHGRSDNVWERVSGCYTATGGERSFILGNFEKQLNDTLKKTGNTYSLPPGAPRICCYFVFDEASLIAVDKNSIPASDTLGIAPGKKLILNNINFAVNDSTLDPASYAILDNVVASMKTQPVLKVEISGHTDNTGNPVSNQHLSEARARVVARYLISKGIDAKRITTKGYGSSKPVSTTDQNKNRRVEFLFSQ